MQTYISKQKSNSRNAVGVMILNAYSRRKNWVLILWGIFLVLFVFELVHAFTKSPAGILPLSAFGVTVVPFFSFYVTVDFSISSKGIEVGSWLLRLLRLNSGRLGLIKWDTVYLDEIFPWVFCFFPFPHGHYNALLNTDSWKFLNNICCRVESRGGRPSNKKLRKKILKNSATKIQFMQNS